MTDVLAYPFRIAELHRADIPMVRLAAYMAELGRLLGSPDDVHFDRVDDGSLTIVANVDAAAKPVVSPRIRAAAAGSATPDASRAWRALNEMLAKDRATAAIVLPGGEMIQLLGRVDLETEVPGFWQPTTIQGRLVRVEGTGDEVRLGLDGDTGFAGTITLPADRAPSVAGHFHSFIRISGSGRWKRDSEGQWRLEKLVADAITPLSDDSLDGVLDRIRDAFGKQDAAAIAETVRLLRSA